MQPPKCSCGRYPDIFGHHKLCCRHGAVNNNPTQARYAAHNIIRDSIIQCCQLANVKARVDRIPASDSTSQRRRYGDLIAFFSVGHARSGTSRSANTLWDSIVGDVSLVHPRHGDTDDHNLWGVWNESALHSRIAAKVLRYSDYNNTSHAFLPMVTTTYNDMSNDLMRFIWFLAEQQAFHAMSGEMLGEAPLDVARLFARRMRARVACAIAVGTARRLVGSTAHAPSSITSGLPIHPSGPFRDRSIDEPLIPW